MIAKILILLLIRQIASEAQSVEEVHDLRCTRLETEAFGNFSCIFDNTTVISRNDLRINQMADEEIKALLFGNESAPNDKVKFLPIFINETFPRVSVLRASDCAIKEIRRENFDNLHYLSEVWLERNQIEKIKSDTFVGLWRLYRIRLSE